MTLEERVEQEKLQIEENWEKLAYAVTLDNQHLFDTCLQNIKEHEQLAEWLEELKELREYFNSTEIGKYRFQKGYNKAIDDFAGRLIRYVDCGHLCSPTEMRWSDLSVVEMVKKLAEQLKAGD